MPKAISWESTNMKEEIFEGMQTKKKRFKGKRRS